MRIVSGIAGGLPLDVPKGQDIRPTMDKVRAALFDSIGESIIDARVADLFAGSGALGIEALSRGAAHATFVENDRRALACIAGNLKRAGLAPKATVIPLTLASFLGRQDQPGSSPQTARFDFVFADPPYASRPGTRDHAPELLGEAGVLRLIKADGYFVLELPAGRTTDLPSHWRTVRDRNYGRTRLLVLSPASLPVR